MSQGLTEIMCGLWEGQLLSKKAPLMLWCVCVCVCGGGGGGGAGNGYCWYFKYINPDKCNLQDTPSLSLIRFSMLLYNVVIYTIKF